MKKFNTVLYSLKAVCILNIKKVDFNIVYFKNTSTVEMHIVS